MHRLDRANEAIHRYDQREVSAEATIEELRALLSGYGDLATQLHGAIRLLFPQDLTPGGRSILEHVANGDADLIAPTCTDPACRP